jgi:hypothetical protein
MIKIKQDKKLKKAAEHVKYEITMFRSTTKQLYYFEQMGHKDRKTDQLLINVFLESFAIHSYNLFRFFYSVKNRRTTDIIAEDFNIRRGFFKSNRTPKKKLKNIENKRNKEIAHLTYNRIYRNKRTKPWNVGLISKHMEQTIKAFIDSLPDKHHSLFNNI